MAKGSFPGCLRRKVIRKRVKNVNHRTINARCEKTLRIAEQIVQNLQKFEDTFGSSDEDDEFHGFSSEECGLIAYKHVNTSHGRRSVPGILSSRIDLNTKNVTTRLAHARRSLDESSTQKKSKGRKYATSYKAYSKWKVPNIEGEHDTSESPNSNGQPDSPSFAPQSSGFTKYKNSNLDFHRLSKNATLQHTVSSKQSSTSRHKGSPIKPATFIAPSLANQRKHRVTNVTPTCLKIQISKTNKSQPGEAQQSAKSLLGRNGRSKARSFVLPTKSSRSSRIIKANPKYIDSDENVSKGASGMPKVGLSSLEKSSKEEMPPTIKMCQVQGRPLLKQPTFRMATLAKINDKPQTSRLPTKDNGISTRMRARKLIKRARFKHPTSSSTLIVGNDYDEDDIKKNLIREATFKMPSKTQKNVHEPVSKSSDLSDLGLPAQMWKKLGKNEIRYNGTASAWTRQEIHNLLHGAHTFANSWRRIARHYEYQPMHRDWLSVKAKLKTLQNYGLLSSNLKVKSSVLLQLKHRYSSNPNVTVFAQQELKSRGMDGNVECEANSVGEDEDEDEENSQSSQAPRKGSVTMQKYHIQCYKKWIGTLSTEPPSSHSIYLGLEKKLFMSLCTPQRLSSEQVSWSVREIHNIIHGFHIFGSCEWSMVHKLYLFQKTHDIVAIRTRFNVIRSKGMIAHGKVKSEVLQLLQPLLSIAGKRYYELSPRAGLISKSVKKQASSNAPKRSGIRVARKRSSINDDDLKSPPRKQAYHLFGTVPVWDESSSSSGLNRLEDSLSDCEENGKAKLQELSSKRKSRKTKNTADSSRKKGRSTDSGKTAGSSRGPRIKHVCRRASLVTGQKVAVYSDEMSDLHLSALPKNEREKIAAEVEKHRGALSDSTVSSDSETDAMGTVKQMLKKSDRLSKIVGKRKSQKVSSRSGCKMCRNCKLPKCGVCEYCRDASRDGTCLGLPPCLNPPEVTNVRGGSKTSSSTQKQSTVGMSSMETRKSSTPCLYERRPNSRTSSRPVGILLSPDSRRRLQQELQEHARLSPSIVKIDDWKERYELEDLWTTGGVNIITSTTPSTRFLCFLCGSMGKARPIRRSSIESESSSSSVEIFDQKPLFIFCCSCCEPFHPFCLDDHEQQAAISNAKKGNWICKRCQFCNVCGRTDNLLECRRCSKTYHSNCLGPGYPNKQSKNHVWVCMRCVRCRSCGASKPGRCPGSRWTHDFQLCQRCGDLFDKGNFCPICRRCYRDEDYESRMVQCGTCKRWVHSRCESLTNEMYALLSHLPDDVQYVCPDCDGRRSKVEMEFHDDCENVLAEEANSDSSLEGDKMKNMLQNLPSPPWRKILENEIQSGIESVMMALFHNKEAACILKKTVAQEELAVGRPVDLFAVRFSVHNRRYSSVSEFSSDVCNILDTIRDDSSSDVQSPSQGRKKRQIEGGPRNAFCKEMQQVFPWFDVETGRVQDTSDVPEDLLPHATLPPSIDHNYAQWQDRDIAISAIAPETPLKSARCEISSDTDSIGMILYSHKSNSQFDDRRQCLFCGKYGDDLPTVAGRLLYCGQDEWVHVNCALWSAEVFERHDGSLQNVYSAVSRGRMMKCELCKLPGATVGCNTRDCPQNFHFACAKLGQCSFQDDKKVFCPKHAKNVDSELVAEEGFEVARRVVVDSDDLRPNKRWQRGVQSDNVTILMGSAIVHQLGHLTLASDSKEHLIPVHFRMTRMFWSTVHAGRKVRYTITVMEQKSSLDATPSPKSSDITKGEKVEHGNHTISHADEREQVKTPGNRDATACKSNLLTRLQDAASSVKERRKSCDEPGPKAPRSRRFSGNSYTVVGLSRRTMPQNITPIPSSLVATPALQQSLSVTPSSPPRLPVIDVEKDAVVISHQNPYLNIQLGPVDQAEHDPKSAIQAGILKAMDKCVMESQNIPQQVPTQFTEPPCASIAHAQILMNHGSSGGLLHSCNKALLETDVKKSNDIMNEDLISHEKTSTPEAVIQAGGRNKEDDTEQQSNHMLEHLEMPLLLETSKLNESTSPDIEPSRSNSISLTDQTSCHLEKNLSESSLFSESGHNAVTFRKSTGATDTATPMEQICEPKLSINTNLDITPVDKQPPDGVISLLQQAKTAHNSDSPSMQNSPVGSSSNPHSINLWWKSKKKDDAACVRSTKSKSRKGSDEEFLPYDGTASVSSTYTIMTRLTKSKSIDSLSGDLFTESISKNDENQPCNTESSSGKELKVILCDIHDGDSISVLKSPAKKDANNKSKSISEDQLGKKDELFTDYVRCSDSSSIDGNSISDIHSSADNAKRKSALSRKKRLRDFAKTGDTISENNSELVTRSKKRLFTKSSEDLPLRDVIPAKCKGDTAAVRSSTADSQRVRSQSDDSPAKVKIQNQENERRYPRRNPFTCLRSFSGLSPNYAIQSYARKTPDKCEKLSSTPCDMSTGDKNLNSLAKRSQKNSKSLKSMPLIAPESCGVTSHGACDSIPRKVSDARETRSGRARSLSLEFSQHMLCKKGSLTKPGVAKQSQLTSDFTVNKAVPLSRELVTVTDSSVDEDKAVQMGNKRQQKNTVDDLSIDPQDAKMQVASMSQDVAEEDLPPIEVERGIIETEAKCTAHMNLDDSDAEVVNVKEKNTQRPPLASSPVTVITSNNAEHRVLTPSDEFSETNANQHSSTLCPAVECNSIETIPKSNTNKASVVPGVHIPVHQQHLVSRANHIPVGLNFSSVEDIESPLSPRDEPNLPLPVETEATASSFLVTSECPVLNVDEVQSILAMPPAALVTCTPSSFLTSPTLTSAPCNEDASNVIGKQNNTNSHHPPPFRQSPYIQQHYVPLNVQTYDSTTEQSPKVLMKYDGKQAYLLCSPQPVLSSPQLQNIKQIEPDMGVVSQPLNKHHAHAAYQFMQPQLIYPPPAIEPRPVYVATPMVKLADDVTVATPQSQQFQYPVSSTSQSISSLYSVKKRHKTPQLPKQCDTKNDGKVTSLPDPVPSTQVSTQGSLPAESSTATATATATVSQMNTLEKMIEFYSNKNNLSANEKQIVRAIIAQHIRNQSLPLPTPDNSQIAPVTSTESAAATQVQLPKSTKRRKSVSASNKEPLCKKSKRPNKESSHCNTITDVSNIICPQRSLLLDIYMKVMHAENSSNDKLMKKWRDNVRHLLKYHIPLDIPFYSRRSSKDKQTKLPPPPPTTKHSELVYEITSEDGYHAKGSNLQELVINLLDAVQECRSDAFIPPNSLCLASVISPHSFIGISQDAIRFLVEQLQGAKHCQRYKAKYYKHKESIPEVVTHINPHGCARAEKFQGRSKPDMFSFLASKHRVPPSYDPSQTQNIDMQQNSTRRPTSMDLPMAMRFRHLKTSAREAVGVYRSAIHGRGLFCKRDIEAGEMVMEYTGEAIRCFMTDRREKMYESKGIGCYMFRMDDTYVVDATMMGSGARFINHSCEPSCYSRIVSIDGKKHIIIFALRKILRGEELTYDYKFPIEAEDQKIMCNCGSKTCRKYMN